MSEDQGSKRCARCKQYKPVDDFQQVNVGARGGRTDRRGRRISYCSICIKVKRKEDHKRAHADPVYRKKASEATMRSRWRRLNREIGVDEVKFRMMEEEQKGLCAICGKPETAMFKGTLRRLCIDHNHETGKIRQLLCLDCNAGIGRFKEDPDLLRKAIEYLARHNKE